MQLIKSPYIGQIVCDCRFRHLRIISVDEDGDGIVLEDGGHCSYRHCCDTFPHEDINIKNICDLYNKNYTETS